jgi:general secretion pathway protein F
MPVFAYRALDRTGRPTEGRVTADSRSAATKQIAATGVHPVSVEEQGTAARVAGPARHAGRVSRAAVEVFTRGLANLLAAGVSLSRALHILARETAQPAAKAQWTAIHDDVVGGAALADALGRWPRSFSAVHVAMVRAGETGGFLDLVLGQIADFRSREQDLKARVKAALVYPVVLAVLAGLVLTFLLTYFIPRFSKIFAEFGGSLPALTRAIVRLSEMVTDHWFVLAAAATLLFLAAQRAMASESGRRRLDQAVLALPGIGVVAARFALVRFCGMLGTLLGAGVPLVAALQVAREAIGNQVLADAVTRAVDRVQRGEALATSLAVAPRLFPPSVLEMVAVAEESGRLEKELTRLASTFEAELDRRLRVLVSLAEPALLFVMAAVVGTVVIGMLLPVFTLQELIR